MSDISYTWEDYIDLNEKLVALFICEANNFIFN